MTTERESSVRYTWPDGKKSAVVLSFDVDAESPVFFRDPEAAANRLGLVEEHRYGVRAGLPRILRMLRDRDLPASFFIPAHTIREHPEAVDLIAAEGHEIGCHGDVHEALKGLSESEEQSILERQLEAFDALLQIRPVGYRAPSWDLNLHTPALLKRFGFLYDSSLMGNDIPYSVETPAGPLTEVPVQWLLDDAPFYRHVYGAANQIAEPDRVVRLWQQEFKALHAENGCFVLTMHPWITGRPGRMDALNELLDYISAFDGVWFATALQVAQWEESRRQSVDGS